VVSSNRRPEGDSLHGSIGDRVRRPGRSDKIGGRLYIDGERAVAPRTGVSVATSAPTDVDAYPVSRCVVGCSTDPGRAPIMLGVLVVLVLSLLGSSMFHFSV